MHFIVVTTGYLGLMEKIGTNLKKDRQTDIERLDGQTDGRTDRCLDGKQTDRQMDSLTDGRTDKQSTHHKL